MVAVLVAALARLGTLELGRRRTEQELAVLGGPGCLDLVRQTLNRAVLGEFRLVEVQQGLGRLDVQCTRAKQRRLPRCLL